MTLLIALMANAMHAHLLGQPFIDTGWIVFLWFLHLVYHTSTTRTTK